MKKKFLRVTFIILLMLPLIAFAHFIVFPQETRCILIRYADFEKKENIYFRKNTSVDKIRVLQNIQSIAERRVKDFWGQYSLFDYQLIYCNNENDFNNYGHPGAPAATQLKMGAYVVLKEESLDIDILSHEISHTVLYNNIGWFKTRFKIPTWFHEGLAMQVDDRSYYSIDTLMAKKKAGQILPDVTAMQKPAEFFSGTTENIMLNYSTAKYIVAKWLDNHSLQKFVTSIKNGASFEKVYYEEAEEK